MNQKVTKAVSFFLLIVMLGTVAISVIAYFM